MAYSQAYLDHFSNPRGIGEIETPGVTLLTTHADCAPLIVYDRNNKILGQAHAGWRSLASGIVSELVSSVRSLDGKTPGDIKVWLGPTIRACCYPVGQEVADRFPDECLVRVGDSSRLGMGRFIRYELQRLDLDPENFTDSGICTSCHPEFSSFRRDGHNVKAMACVCGLP